MHWRSRGYHGQERVRSTNTHREDGISGGYLFAGIRRNRSPSRPFAYILMCEYGSILHPSNTILALDMCERLRVRNCGHIALYQ
ncbi:hypothetical protein TELCIR_24044, partial [Teladorsagia circumcincta]